MFPRRLCSVAGGQGIRRAAAALLILLLAVSIPASGAAEFEGFDAEDFDVGEAAAEDLDVASPSLPVSSSAPSPEASPVSGSSSSGRSSSDPLVRNPRANLDLWDEDEFVGIPASQWPPSEAPMTGSDVTEEEEVPTLPPPAAATSTSAIIRRFSIEILCVSFLICFAINYFTGKRENENIALAWATKFATRDAVFDKNFSLLGMGDSKDAPLLLKEGQNVFKFYASGRRYCQGMLATMELKSRHDLIARIAGWVFPQKDTISFEVVMNEDAMDHVVVALARKKSAKRMLKEEKDLARFAAAVTGPPAGVGRKWVPDELMVAAESKEVAADMINETVIDQVFGEKAFEKFGKWFISLHFSDQLQGPNKVLMLKLVLPDAHNMAEITRLVALVPYYIDLVGRYKLSPHARSKTETARAKAAQEAYKEQQSARQEALQKKRADKKLADENETKLSAEALRKKEEKERARLLKKSMPKVKKLR